LTADESRSYQQLLRDASHEIRRMALDRPWSEVEQELQRQGFRRIHARDNQHTSDYEYLVTQEGWRAGDQSAHALYLEFSVDRRSAADVPSANPGCVMNAAAGLSAEPNRSYAQALVGGAYAEGSVLFCGLRLSEAAAAAKDYPILKKVAVTYDLIRDRWSETVPHGFHLWLTFGDSPRSDRRGKRLYFTAESGLDAFQDWQGRPLAEQFESKDTLGEFRGWGSTEWGPPR
jgi:hypothetical protein